ncbi:amino acid ABC transporter permease [Polaromonas jejuensis]|uniref:Amino acid ABC transporter permease n=1 Tax=Polaromonas jejuensis TaxID=457502 RepID=A0ABW0QIT6_9BURK|nr:amino acid ABC transporter permease [Polaromonas jejuensis]
MKSNSPALRWVRRNLFATAADSTLSVVCISWCLWMMSSLISWAIFTAHWEVVAENIRVFMVGTYPRDMMWRPWACAAILSLLSGMAMGGVAGPLRKITLPMIALACAAGASGYVLEFTALDLSSLCVALAGVGWLAAGLWRPVRRFSVVAWVVGIVAITLLLAPAGMERWGGLLMSVLFTLLASVLSVPLGVALAFGRRSRYPSARIICSAYIEVMRSLPLILVVYCIWIVMPLLMPSNAGPDLGRGLLGFTLFFAAYVAEYVRSGLQSVPRGQVEAAQSLGMAPGQVNRDIVLPQAIRVVMPALVGNVLDIFNTVPLLFIIGMTDFLRAGQMVLVNPQSGNRTYEVYVFMFAVYLAMASLITYGARRLEARMASGRG